MEEEEKSSNSINKLHVCANETVKKQELKFVSIVWHTVFPPKYGGQKLVAQFNENLASQAELICLCAKTNINSAESTYKIVPILPAGKLQFVNPLVWMRILRFLLKEKTTHLVLEHPYHGVAALLAKKIQGLKLIVHSHNIEFSRFREQRKYWWPLLARFEKWIHRKADWNLFTTSEDMQFAQENFQLPVEKCMVIPYGGSMNTNPHSREEARRIIAGKYGIHPNEKILLFAGTLDYAPNAKAVENLFHIVAPALKDFSSFRFRILICGRNSFKAFSYLNHLKHDHITMTGEVEDATLLFAAADVFVNPVTSGGGVQTKNIDALRCGLNVICFEHMLNGIPVATVKEKLFIAGKNDWGMFVKQLLEACTAPSMPVSNDFFEYFNQYEHIKTFITRLNNES